CRAVGSAECRPATLPAYQPFHIRHLLPASASGAARTTAASTRGHSTARTDRDWARSDLQDRTASHGSKVVKPKVRVGWEERDGRSWQPEPHPSTMCG